MCSVIVLNWIVGLKWVSSSSFCRNWRDWYQLRCDGMEWDTGIRDSLDTARCCQATAQRKRNQQHFTINFHLFAKYQSVNVSEKQKAWLNPYEQHQTSKLCWVWVVQHIYHGSDKSDVWQHGADCNRVCRPGGGPADSAHCSTHQPDINIECYTSKQRRSSHR